MPGSIIGDHNIQPAITVHIAQSDGEYACTRGKGLLGLEGAIPVTQSHAGILGTRIGGHNIEPAIAVHISQSHGAWVCPHGIGLLGLKGTIAVTQ